MRVTGPKKIAYMPLPLEFIVNHLREAAGKEPPASPRKKQAELLAWTLNEFKEEKETVMGEASALLIKSVFEAFRIDPILDEHVNMHNAMRAAAVWVKNEAAGQLDKAMLEGLDFVIDDPASIAELRDNFNALAAKEPDAAIAQNFKAIAEKTTAIIDGTATTQDQEDLADRLLHGVEKISTDWIEFLRSAQHLSHWLLLHKFNDLSQKTIGELSSVENYATPRKLQMNSRF